MEQNHFEVPLVDYGSTQGRHGWQDPQGLDLAWILQNRKRWRHTADVVATTQRCDLPVYFFDGFIIVIVVNPPERRLPKRTSVHCGGLACQRLAVAALVLVVEFQVWGYKFR